jgi:hypothetical protein
MTRCQVSVDTQIAGAFWDTALGQGGLSIVHVTFVENSVDHQCFDQHMRLMEGRLCVGQMSSKSYGR